VGIRAARRAALVLVAGVVVLGAGYAGALLTTPSAASALAPPASSAAAKTAPPDAAVATAPFVVVIDAGHQAHGNNALEPIGPGSKSKRAKVSSGTSGIFTHKHESTINLQVALRLRKALVAAGIKVVMIRTTQSVDIPNSKRAKMANSAHADLFVRIHCDGAAHSVRGFLTLVPARNSWTKPIFTASARAGRDVHAACLAATGARDRGISRRGDLSGFNWSHVPAVLVEMGNMKNAKEDRNLASASYQRKIVAGITAGVLRFAAGK
jgi:N-acetylmuramoyl-L-alanine amidase